MDILLSWCKCDVQIKDTFLSHKIVFGRRYLRFFRTLDGSVVAADDMFGSTKNSLQRDMISFKKISKHVFLAQKNH